MYTWQSALQAARDLGNGWRVPNFKELQSLVEEACYSPAINETLFPATVITYYWTSSPVADAGYYAWLVGFHNGDTYNHNKDYNYYVRVVRSGQ